ncbi:MAG: hypothetical protein HQ483_02450 [Rhodospirillales bacterium]|nr:hypothetical protein [Rhodospirillales bacterium]
MQSPVFPAVHLSMLQSVQLPKVLRVKLTHPHAPAIVDLQAAVASELAKSRRLASLNQGASVAVAIGSRGISGIAQVARATVDHLKASGFSPFIVPGMGSHGGGTADGQIAVLSGLGVTEDSMGVPIRATMEVVNYGTSSQGVDAMFDKNAAEADAVIVINRVKSHTSFDRPIESGLTKMVAVGLGKGEGARRVHVLGPRGLRDVLPELARISIANSPICYGIALVENPHKQLVVIEGVEPENFYATDERLLVRAKSLLARLPFAQIDALVCELVGKNISGAGMDFAVTARTDIRGIENPPTPLIHRIGVLGVTPESKGNANGIGMADYAPMDFINSIDLHSIYFNGVTAAIVEKGRIPLVLPHDLDVFRACVSTAWVADPTEARFCMIKSTAQMNEVLVSPTLFADIEDSPDMEVLEQARAIEFSKEGKLLTHCSG